MKIKRAVIFDLDGTLAPTIEVLKNFFIKRAKELSGRDISHLELSNAFHYDFLTFMSNLGITDSAHIETLEFELRDLESKQSNSDFFDGLTQLIQQLHQAKFDLYLWTLRYQQSALEILKHNQVHNYFVDHHCGDHYEPKPIASGLKDKFTNHYQELYMIGDTVTDILGGKNLGATTIGVTWANTNSPEMLTHAGADYIFENISELKNFFIK